MPAADPETRAEVLHAVVAFLAASLAWLLLSAIATAAVGSRLQPDLPLDEALRSPTLFAFGALLQTTGLGVVVHLLSGWFPSTRPTRPGLRAYVLAGLSGLSVGLLPGWLAENLQRLTDTGSTLDQLQEVLAVAPVGAKVGLVVAICVVAPVSEELAFRGFLWHHLRRVLPLLAVLPISSLLFVGYHLDAVQTPTLVPTALLLGWIRWRSGSFGPAIAAHAANNILAMVMLLSLDLDSVPPIPLWLALLGTLASWSLATLIPSTRS